MRTMRIIALIFLMIGVDARAERITEPKCLSKSIDFWYQVYTKLDNDTVFVLDAKSKDLSVLWKASISSDDRLRKSEIRRIKTHYLKHGKKVRIVSGIRSKFQEGLVRDAMYRKDVESEINKMSLPLELSALPHVESSYNPKARSKVGALGMWQVMPATARLHGFDPKKMMHPVYNTRAGLAVLKEAYDELKSWPLAITSYNHGLNGVRRAVKEVGSTDLCEVLDKYDGPRFGVSSRNFYASFLAVLRYLREEGRLSE
jgi:hypothetical protein